MTEKEKIESQIRLFELQLEEMRATPEGHRLSNYNMQLENIAKHIKMLRKMLGELNE